MGSLFSLFVYSGTLVMDRGISRFNEGCRRMADEHPKKFLDNDSVIVSQTITANRYDALISRKK
jgi:hypothetical protein